MLRLTSEKCESWPDNSQKRRTVWVVSGKLHLHFNDCLKVWTVQGKQGTGWKCEQSKVSRALAESECHPFSPCSCHSCCNCSKNIHDEFSNQSRNLREKKILLPGDIYCHSTVDWKDRLHHFQPDAWLYIFLQPAEFHCQEILNNNLVIQKLYHLNSGLTRLLIRIRVKN